MKLSVSNSDCTVISLLGKCINMQHTSFRFKKYTLLLEPTGHAVYVYTEATERSPAN
jgi:hypothetical protein